MYVALGRLFSDKAHSCSSFKLAWLPIVNFWLTPLESREWRGARVFLLLVFSAGVEFALVILLSTGTAESFVVGAGDWGFEGGFDRGADDLRSLLKSFPKSPVRLLDSMIGLKS